MQVMKDIIMTLVAGLLAYTGTNSPYVEEHVDRIEINEYRPAAAHPQTLYQVIFWEYKEHVPYYNKKTGLTKYRSGHVILDWRRWYTGDPVPRYDHRLKQYIFMFYDKRSKVFRRIIAHAYSRSITDYDPEVYDQRRHPTALRRKLR
jgi:hypothetical protein